MRAGGFSRSPGPFLCGFALVRVQLGRRVTANDGEVRVRQPCPVIVARFDESTTHTDLDDMRHLIDLFSEAVSFSRELEHAADKRQYLTACRGRHLALRNGAVDT